jgi:hypothetical protein
VAAAATATATARRRKKKRQIANAKGSPPIPGSQGGKNQVRERIRTGEIISTG